MEKESLHSAMASGSLACVVSTGALAQGVDVPFFAHVFIDGLPFSLLDLLQMVGRGLRGGGMRTCELAWDTNDVYHFARLKHHFEIK